MANLIQKTFNPDLSSHKSDMKDLAQSSLYRLHKATYCAIHISSEMCQVMNLKDNIQYVLLDDKPGCRRTYWYTTSFIAGHRAFIQNIYQPYRVTHHVFWILSLVSVQSFHPRSATSSIAGFNVRMRLPRHSRPLHPSFTSYESIDYSNAPR